MKSKFLLTLFLIGVFPAVLLTGVYFYMIFTQAPLAAKAGQGRPIDQAAQQVVIAGLQRNVESISSSMFAAIKRAHDDIPNLVAHNQTTDLDNFIHSHQGIEGIAVLSLKGKLLNNLPAAPPLVDSNYAGSDEFQKITQRFAEQGGSVFQFYTQRLGYPAFIYAIPITADSFVEAVLNLEIFFRGMDAKSGEIALLDAASGRYLFNSDPAKLNSTFNSGQEPWLSKVQTDLTNKQSGTSLSGSGSVAVYSYLGFGSFGIVHSFPLLGLQGSAPQAAAKAPGLDNIPELLKSPVVQVSIIALAACVGWILIVGSLCYGMILAPLRRASGAVLNASQGKGSLTPEMAKRFGGDEVGQMVQAASFLMTKLEEEKQQAHQESEEALKRGRAELDAKSRESSNQVNAAQQQAQAARNEANEKNQNLNDKLKELDALKGMSEGLRNQNEQAKAENAKLRGQINEISESQADFQKQIAGTQNELKEMESKMFKAVAASSAIHVSQVRAMAIKTMSEELKTTLGIIKGYVSSTLGSTQGGINEKQQEFLGMVINRSARLEKFINDLVDIYQVEIEQQDAKTEEVNLGSEIEGLAFNFQAQAEVKNIKMKIEVKPDIPKVSIVRRRFNQLWNILYLQIIKDAPRGSSVTIGVEPIGDNVKVIVPDPGLIVVPDSLPKLFDEFYDPKHPASPQLAGTGLKFALVKTILAAHGGGAVAEKGDPGTRLILTFPTKIKKAASPSPMVAPSPSMTAPGPKIGISPSLTAPPLRPTPGVAAPGGIGLPKPPALGATPSIGLPKPPMPGAPAGAPFLGVPKPTAPGATPSIGLPKPLMPGAPAGTPSLGTPKPATPAGAGGGVLDALISGGNIPSINAPAAKPAIPSTPGAPVPPLSPALKPPALQVPSLGIPSAALGAVPPAVPKPAMSPSMAGALDSLLDKKPAPPSVPGLSSIPKPPVPGVPPMPGAAAPRPPIPGIPSAAPAIPSAAPKPPIPGIPPMSGAAPPVGAPAAPKVIPTNIKPTAPPPGILDLDNVDGMKLDASAPNPSRASGSAPAAPPMPGAPRPVMPPPGAMPGGLRPPVPPPGMPPMGAAKPPGVPPGGLDVSKTQAPQKDDGELIE